MINTTLEQEVLYPVLQIQTSLALNLYSARDFSRPSLKRGLNLAKYHVERNERAHYERCVLRR